MLGSLRTSVARAGRTASQQVRRMATDAIAEVEKEAAHAQKEANKCAEISRGTACWALRMTEAVMSGAPGSQHRPTAACSQRWVPAAPPAAPIGGLDGGAAPAAPFPSKPF